MAINFSSVSLTSNPSNTGANLRISATVTDGNASKWLMDSSSTYLRDSSGNYLLTTNTSGTSQLNYTATQVNSILKIIENYDDSADLSLYLKTSDAASTYQTISGASGYLPKGTYASASSASDYITYSSADSVYNSYYYTYLALKGDYYNNDSNILGLPLNTVYIAYSPSVDPNDFLQGTWSLITTSKPFGTSGSSGSDSYSLSADNNYFYFNVPTFSHNYAHTHSISNYLLCGTVGLVTDAGTLPSGSSYYYPYMASSSSGSFAMALRSETGWMANPSEPRSNKYTEITGEHSHTVTLTSGNTSTAATISLQQFGTAYYTWRKTSMT